MHVIFITSYAGKFTGSDYKNREGVYGSELACIRVAQELSRWYTVTIFVKDDVDEIVDKVRYVSWNKYDQVCFENTPDVCIVSRYINFFLYNTNYAKQTYIWCHDCFLQPAFEGKMLPNDGKHLLKNLLPTIDRIVCVGYAQRDVFFTRRANIDPSKTVVIPNGINETHTPYRMGSSKRVPNSFVWCSNPMQRNLDIVLRFFPLITLLVPDARLDVYYEDLSPELQKLVDSQPNVTCHGKISHEDMLQVFEKTDYWLYPTKFFETCCTVAFETAYHGCIQITSNVGALKENVKGIVIEHDPLSDEFEKELLDVLQYLSENPTVKEQIRSRQRYFSKQQTWQQRGLMWQSLIETGSVKSNTGSFSNYMVNESSNELTSFILMVPPQKVALPCDIRKFKNTLPSAVELTWLEKMREFVNDDTQSYLGLFRNGQYSSHIQDYYFFILEEFKNRPKLCVCFLPSGSKVYEKANVSLRKKFDVACAHEASIILTKQAARALIDTPFTGSFGEFVYGSFGANTRTCTNETVFQHVSPDYSLEKPQVTIGAAIMMKNEERNIEQSLRTTAPYVNAFVLYDTGSTDRTVQVCEQWCEREGIPLYLKKGTFVDFCVSRNTMIDYAEKETDLNFLLLLDSGDEVRKGDSMWECVPKNPHQRAFYVNQFWDLGSDTKNLSFSNVRVISTHSNLRYVYPVHEVVDVQPILIDAERSTVGELETIVYQDRTTDMGKSNKRWISDKGIIQKFLLKNKLDTRMTFYLAQTYKCLKEDEQAYNVYKKRTTLNGFMDEVQQSYIEMYNIYTRNTFVSHEEILRQLQDGWKRFARGEYAHYIAKLYALQAENISKTGQTINDKSLQLYNSAYEWAKKACSAPYPTHIKLWIERVVFEHDRWNILAIVAYYTNNLQEGIIALRQALKSQPMNEMNVNLTGAYAKRGFML